ncbi:sugar phosphate isomerase/epimerase, partial [Candidatus Poribacteria bacterium]|nr:sugar phosphate isomerase/epimerase [Candidatus Poribacteria bacterium]
MKISVLSYSLRELLNEGKMDVFGYLETCKYRYHLSAADIWSGFIPNTDDNFLKKLKDGLDEREMELADLCVDGAHVWEDNPEARENNYQRALTFLKAAVTSGARFVRIDAGGRNESWTPEQFDFIVSRYKEYSQFAYDHGFKMGLENHWGPERSWANLKKVYEAVS